VSYGSRDMRWASKFLAVVCVLLTVVLWAVTMVTDPRPGPIGAAAALTAIVAGMVVFILSG
jgi:hypothetical protein